MHRRPRTPLIVAAVAVLVLAVGTTIFFTHWHEFPGGAEVGYSSYQPLEALSAPSSTGVLWSGTAVAGLAVTAVGLLLLAGVAGFLIGRRNASGLVG
ncbi:hypothetical protein ACXR2U_13045 [Jatrophihabitans sp. YIM 134969]